MRTYWTLPKNNNDFRVNLFRYKNWRALMVSTSGATTINDCQIYLGLAVLIILIHDFIYIYIYIYEYILYANEGFLLIFNFI
jgi:hypothetical protein